MPKTTKHHKTAKSKQRASWRGQMTFGLVSFSVEAFNAFDKSGSDIHFHQLHASCHRRIHYAKMCPVHGEVSNDEIVSGFEYKKGKYVEIASDELESLRTENDRALKIEAFIGPTAIDPLYFDGRMYFLAPDGKNAQEPYATVLAAMTSTERYGVGQMVFSGKDQIVLVRPLQGALHVAMLNYEAEIRSPKQVVGEVPVIKNRAKQVKLAETLIEQWSQDDFDFSQYEDTHRQQVEKLVNAKIHGRKIVQPKDKEESEDPLDLMEALRRSLMKTSATQGSSKNKKSKGHSRKRTG